MENQRKKKSSRGAIAAGVFIAISDESFAKLKAKYQKEA